MAAIPSTLQTVYDQLELHHVLLVFVLLTTVGAATDPLEWDEGSFLLNAEHLYSGDDAFEDSRPLALSAVIAAVWQLTGESTFAARMIIVLFGVLSIIIVHRLAAREFADPMPVTLTFAFSPLLLYWSFHAYTDVMGLFFVLTGLYAYRRDRPLVAGVMLAVATTVRYLFLLFAVGMAAAYLYQKLQDLPRYTLGGVLGMQPFFWYGHLEYGSPLAKAFMYTNRVTRWSSSHLFATTLEGVDAMIWMLSGLIPATVKSWKQMLTVEKSLVIVYAAFMLLFSGNPFTRYWLAILPILLIVAYRGLDKKWFAVAASIMLITSAYGVYDENRYDAACSQPLEEAHAYLEDKQGPIVSDHWAITGYVLDKKIYSPYTTYEELRQNFSARYALTTDDALPYPEEARFSSTCRTYHIYRLTAPTG